MSEANNAPHADLAPPGTVCRKCWHGLKGLGIASVCPECGQPIARAVDAAWWGAHPPAPLTRLAGSIGAFLWGCAAFFVLFATVATLEILAIRPPDSGALDILLGLLLVGLWSWLAVSLLRALRAARAARLAGKWTSTVGVIAAAISCAACAVAQAVSMIHPRVYDGWTNVAPIVFAGSLIVTLVSWAFAQRCAASYIGRSALSPLAWVQAGLAVLLALIFTVLTLREVALAWMNDSPRWVQALAGWLERPMLATFGLLFVIMIVNLTLMRRAIRQFLAARLSAA